MSLFLSQAQIEVKTHPFEIMGGEVWIGDHAVPLAEFCDLVFYVMVNTDLAPEDPRRALQARIAGMREVQGYRTGAVCFGDKEGT